MDGKYTNNLQAAILFEGGGRICPPMHLNHFRMEMLNRGIPLNIIQESQDFVFMAGPGDLRIMVTYFDRPADRAVFEPTLGSAVTTILMKDARERVRRHTAHVLVEVNHGVFAGASDNPQLAELFSRIGMKRPGASAGEFNMRVDVLGEICRHLLSVQPATVIHWTQSNMLIAGERFTSFLEQHPGMLTVHPKLFGAEPMPGFSEIPAGLLTLGAADTMGREIYVVPAPVPWIDLYNAVLVFMRIALMPNGYVIPHDDTFGPEGGGSSYLVRHLPAEAHPMAMREPLYELTLRFSQEHHYTTMEHEERTPVTGGIRSVVSEVDPDRRRQGEVIAEWEDRERAAKAIGGSLELYRTSPPTPTLGERLGSVFGRRTTPFGRKH